MEKEKVLIIINPVSGTGKQKSAIKSIDKKIDKINFDYEIVETKYAHHATELASKAAADGYDMVVAVGGDGSVNDVVAGLVNTNTKLGIIPCGSGNGLARCLKIPLSPSKAIETLNDNKMKRIDTMLINGHVCASIAGIGFDALIAKEFQEKPKNTRGFHSYLQLIATEYPKYKAKNYEVEIDGQRISHKAMFVSFANANQFGYEAIVAPDSRVDDGLADVCFIEEIPILSAPPTAVLLFAKKINKSPRVKIWKAKHIKIFNNNLEWVNLDGEAIKMDKELDIVVNHKSLMIVC